jgi:glycosyltransferase involved in cell wall biosynthesis
VTVHAVDIYTADERRLRRRLSHFDRVVTVCKFNIAVLSELGVTQAGNGAIDLVRCGVAVPDIPSNPNQAEAVDVISVGRLVEKKGFDTFIRAMASVCERRAGTKATIVGDGPERAALTELVSQLGLEQNITLAGAKSHSETLELIGQAKVFCLAGQRARNGDCDAVPVVIKEAMARAVAVISTRVGGIPEVVDDEVGWIVDPGSPQQLADAIADALADAKRRMERGAAGRARVLLRRWTVDGQAEGMLRVFECLGEAPGAVHDRAA